MAEHEEARDDGGRFLPGKSGNPGGRPKGPSITTHLRKHANEPVDETVRTAFAKQGIVIEEGETNGEVLSKVMWRRALAGDARVMMAVIDRTDGKAAGKLEIDGKVSGEVRHTHTGGAAFALIAAKVEQLREQAQAQLPDVVEAEVVE